MTSNIHTGKHVCYAKVLWRTTAILTPNFGVFLRQNFCVIALAWRECAILNLKICCRVVIFKRLSLAFYTLHMHGKGVQHTFRGPENI